MNSLIDKDWSDIDKDLLKEKDLKKLLKTTPYTGCLTKMLSKFDIRYR